MDISIIGNAGNFQTQSGATVGAVYPPIVATTPGADVPATPPVAAVSSPSTPSAEAVKTAVDTINASLASNGNARNVQFAVDPSSKRVVIQVIDQHTHKVIRQIPNEEIIQMSLSLNRKLGLVIDQQA